MRTKMVFRTKFRKIMDAFWLREDKKELLPNCECEYLDNDFRLLSVSSETIFYENELKPVLESYEISFSSASNRNTCIQQKPTN